MLCFLSKFYCRYNLLLLYQRASTRRVLLRPQPRTPTSCQAQRAIWQTRPRVGAVTPTALLQPVHCIPESRIIACMYNNLRITILNEEPYRLSEQWKRFASEYPTPRFKTHSITWSLKWLTFRFAYSSVRWWSTWQLNNAASAMHCRPVSKRWPMT